MNLVFIGTRDGVNDKGIEVIFTLRNLCLKVADQVVGKECYILSTGCIFILSNKVETMLTFQTSYHLFPISSLDNDMVRHKSESS